MIMANDTLGGQILIMIRDELNRVPAPTECTITKSYSDGHVDVQTSNGNITYVRCYGGTGVGTDGVVLFRENDTTKPIVITSTDLTGIYELIGEINEYVTR